MRGRFGYNDNPNRLEFKYVLCSILVHNAIKLTNVNSTLFIHEENSLFYFKMDKQEAENDV